MLSLNISKGELEEKLVCAKFAHTTKHGAVKGKTQTKNRITQIEKTL